MTLLYNSAFFRLFLRSSPFDCFQLFYICSCVPFSLLDLQGYQYIVQAEPTFYRTPNSLPGLQSGNRTTCQSNSIKSTKMEKEEWNWMVPLGRSESSSQKNLGLIKSPDTRIPSERMFMRKNLESLGDLIDAGAVFDQVCECKRPHIARKAEIVVQNPQVKHQVIK